MCPIISLLNDSRIFVHGVFNDLALSISLIQSPFPKKCCSWPGSREMASVVLCCCTHTLGMISARAPTSCTSLMADFDTVLSNWMCMLQYEVWQRSKQALVGGQTSSSPSTCSSHQDGGSPQSIQLAFQASINGDAVPLRDESGGMMSANASVSRDAQQEREMEQGRHSTDGRKGADCEFQGDDGSQVTGGSRAVPRPVSGARPDWEV